MAGLVNKLVSGAIHTVDGGRREEKIGGWDFNGLFVIFMNGLYGHTRYYQSRLL